MEAFDPATISVFSTRNQTAKTDTYFLDSASAVSFFFEEKAFGEGGQLEQPKNRAINKIGHGASWQHGRPGLRTAAHAPWLGPVTTTAVPPASSCPARPPPHAFTLLLPAALPPPAAMHDLDPVFRLWSRSSKMAGLMAALGFQRPLPVQVGGRGGDAGAGMHSWQLLLTLTRSMKHCGVLYELGRCASLPLLHQTLPCLPRHPPAVDAYFQAAVCGRRGGAPPGQLLPGH